MIFHKDAERSLSLVKFVENSGSSLPSFYAEAGD